MEPISQDIYPHPYQQQTNMPTKQEAPSDLEQMFIQSLSLA